MPSARRRCNVLEGISFRVLLFALSFVLEFGNSAAAPLTNHELSTKVFECKGSGWDSTTPACADMPTWDTSAVTDMTSMFAGASSFNLDISAWDTSSVTSMAGMFNGASAFNGDISSWDTHKVRSMHWMFWGASSFNADISSWDTGRVSSMSGIFRAASAFNQNLSDWDTRSLSAEGMEKMFLGSPKLSLSDVNECLESSPCSSDATCSNTDGSFTCACNSGLIDWSKGKVGASCDVNECTAGTHNCALNATCTDTEGSFFCTCNAGFVDWGDAANGTACDVDQCSDRTHNCANQATCTDTNGSFTCECKSGWKSADGGVTCQNIDECSAASDNCDPAHAACEDTDGSFLCSCAIGMQSNDGGVTCTPVPVAEVSFTATLAMPLSAFESSGKDKYKAAVAAVASVEMDSVTTADPREAPARRRRLLADGIMVLTAVEVPADRASAALEALATKLQPALADDGIQLIRFQPEDAPAAAASSGDADSTLSGSGLSSLEWSLVGAALGGAAVVVLCLLRQRCRRATRVAPEPTDAEQRKGKTMVDHGTGTSTDELERQPSLLDASSALPASSHAILHTAVLTTDRSETSDVHVLSSGSAP